MTQAILLAGDRRASRAVRGTSKAYLPLAGKPMLVHVLEALLRTPEVDEVFVVGDPVRLEKALADHGCVALAAASGRAVHLVPQRATLFENVWSAFLRALPPGDPDPEHAVLVVPSDVPLIDPGEISDFLAQATKLDADYVIGLSPEGALEPFLPRGDQPGVEMAYFNLREGRLRQNNLHFVRPLKVHNRHYVQDMYEHRYQREWGAMLGLLWRLLRSELRNLWVIWFYALMHVAGLLHRRGRDRLADAVRGWVSLHTVERGVSDLLRARTRCAITHRGGAALDIDNATDLAAAERMFERWKALQAGGGRA
jgi:GTP:adenosylcobinamide-phosphate guanylyltransferase